MNRYAITLTLTTFATLGFGCTAETRTTEGEESAPLAPASADAPIALSGEYRFAGTVEPLGRITYDVIDVRMSDAQERFERVRAEGATCELVMSNTYRCKNHRGPGAVPSSSLETIGERNREFFAKFEGPARNSLVSRADFLVEWSVKQLGATPDGAFSEYTYLSLADGLVKISLPGPMDGTELMVKDADHLRKWDRRTVAEGRWRWHEDTAVVVLER